MMKTLIKSFEDHLLKHTDQEFVDVLTPHLVGINIINASLVDGVNGIATPSVIYIDIERIMDKESNSKYDLAFIILHELAHYKRIKKKGKEWYLDYILKSDEDSYINTTLFEERFADRYGILIVNILYNINIKERYRNLTASGSVATMCRRMYHMIRVNVRTEEDLNNSLKQYILNVRQ